MKKKSQAISINVIIIAAISLVVLIIIVMIFTGNIGKWRRSTDSCASQRGQCVDARDINPTDGVADACSGTYQNVINYACPGPDGQVGTDDDNEQVCCLST